MKRDMVLVKKILKYVEDNIPSRRNFISLPEFDGYTEETIEYHVNLCAKTGFLEVSPTKSSLIVDLTWSGHDELARLRDNPPA